MSQIAARPVVQIPLEQIFVFKKTNVRSAPTSPEERDGLAYSMSSRTGQIYPILLRRIRDDKFEVIVGSRRLEAAREVKKPTIASIILDDLSDLDAIMLSLVENLHRKDLTPFEEAKAILRLCKEHSMSSKEVAKRINKPLAFVTGRLKILSVPDKVQELLSDKKIPVNHVGIIASLGNPRDQIRYAKVVSKQALSEEDLVTLIRDEVGNKAGRSEQLAKIKLFTPVRTALKVKRFARFLKNKVRPQLALEGPEIKEIRNALREVRDVIKELLSR